MMEWIKNSNSIFRNDKIEPLIQKIEDAINTRDISSAYESE